MKITGISRNVLKLEENNYTSYEGVDVYTHTHTHTHTHTIARTNQYSFSSPLYISLSVLLPLIYNFWFPTLTPTPLLPQRNITLFT